MTACPATPLPRRTASTGHRPRSWTAVPSPRGGGAAGRPGHWAVRRAVVVLAVVISLGGGLAGSATGPPSASARSGSRSRRPSGCRASSTTPPGGAVGFFMVVRNHGVRCPCRSPRWRGRPAGPRCACATTSNGRLAPGTEAAIPLSVRLSCVAGRQRTTDLPVTTRRAPRGRRGRDACGRPASRQAFCSWTSRRRSARGARRSGTSSCPDPCCGRESNGAPGADCGGHASGAEATSLGVAQGVRSGHR